jgi:hypothetical protein
MNIRVVTIRQIGIVKEANMPDALELSLLTGVVGFVGAFAITFKFNFSFCLFYKLVKCVLH